MSPRPLVPTPFNLVSRKQSGHTEALSLSVESLLQRSRGLRTFVVVCLGPELIPLPGCTQRRAWASQTVGAGAVPPRWTSVCGSSQCLLPARLLRGCACVRRPWGSSDSSSVAQAVLPHLGIHRVHCPRLPFASPPCGCTRLPSLLPWVPWWVAGRMFLSCSLE